MSHTGCDIDDDSYLTLGGMGLGGVGPVTGTELSTAAQRLLTDVAADPVGSVSPSTYETGRLVAHAPWLTGHRARLEFLCRTQSPDGSWGGPDGYTAVPTLSATAALLMELARRDRATDQPPELVRAARAGLRAARGWLRPDRGPEIPDTVAVELLLPALRSELAELLPPSVSEELRLPDGFGTDLLDTLRARLAAGTPPPEPVQHCLEIFGTAAAGAEFVRPAAGAVMASPAATATWLGGPDGPRDSTEFLRQLTARGDGSVPNVSPISYFEGAWVLNSLAVSGLVYQPPAELLDRLEAGLTDGGAPAGPGLPADADDTAAVLAALARHGRPRPPDCLRGFQADGYFRCFPTERNPSVTANAHVLEALALYHRHQPDRHQPGTMAAAADTAHWLREQQQPDGSWWDKWHASPYYATSCCVLALDLHDNRTSRAALERAVGWVQRNQRSDGSWGRWSGTVEETAYAIQILTLAGIGDSSVRRGAAFLADPPPVAEDTPLWHGKDIYTPVAVVRAARLAALRLAAHSLSTQPVPEPAPGQPSRTTLHRTTLDR